MIASRKVENLQKASEEMRQTMGPAASNLQFMQCNIRKEEEVSVECGIELLIFLKHMLMA
jgi:hypothetical protein